MVGKVYAFDTDVDCRFVLFLVKSDAIILGQHIDVLLQYLEHFFESTSASDHSPSKFQVTIS